MPLPNLEESVPHFMLTIPSTGKEVSFRHFLVKEEKMLLIALESNEEKLMREAMIQVINSCAVAPIKTDLLAHFDLQYLFLQLRARSVNEIIELSYKCHKTVSFTPDEFEKRFRRKAREGEVLEGSCENVVKVFIPIDDVKVNFSPDHQKQIFVTDTMGVNMRYPNHKTASFMGEEEELKITDAFQRIATCVESVFDSESVYTNFTVKEIGEWIEKLTYPQFAKLQQFFETIPKLSYDAQFHCPKCGYEEIIQIKGLASFFV